MTSSVSPIYYLSAVMKNFAIKPKNVLCFFFNYFFLLITLLIISSYSTAKIKDTDQQQYSDLIYLTK